MRVNQWADFNWLSQENEKVQHFFEQIYKIIYNKLIKHEPKYGNSYILKSNRTLKITRK